ncbi:MAG: PAS domain-containing protein [Alphaproteobacteria bacterium]|nr:PAS domain-containing protein [Alphaproteobacteria bacterium]
MDGETTDQHIKRLESQLRKLRQEARFWEQVFEHIPTMAFVKRAEDLRFIRFNRVGADLIGVPQDELLGKTDYDFFPKEEADFFTSKDREVLDCGVLVDVPQEPIQSAEQGRRWLHTKKIPIFSETGDPLFLVGISEDITERLAMEERIRAHTEQLEAANSQISELNRRLEEDNLRLAAELEVARHIQDIPGHVRAPEFELTQVGFGRYGKRYVGPKYAKRGYLWDPRAVVDPAISANALSISVLGQRRPGLQLFPDVESWVQGYHRPLPPERQPRQLVELALKPELMFSETMKVLAAGVPQLILPKPVVMDRDQLDALAAEVAARRVKAAVASQWYYSDIPPLISRLVRQRAAGQPVLRVEMDFSKEGGLDYETPPPLLEMPHVLQLLSSCGLVDLSRDRPRVEGGPTRVDVWYAPPEIAGGVHFCCETDLHPTPEQKRVCPTWDVQVRTLDVYFPDDPENAGVHVDFWIKFDRSGDFAIRPGSLSVRDPGAPEARAITLRFVDDQLMVMSERIFEAMLLDYDAFEASAAALSLARYGPIGRQIMEIQEAWERCVAPEG